MPHSPKVTKKHKLDIEEPGKPSNSILSTLGRVLSTANVMLFGSNENSKLFAKNKKPSLTTKKRKTPGGSRYRTRLSLGGEAISGIGISMDLGSSLGVLVLKETYETAAVSLKILVDIATRELFEWVRALQETDPATKAAKRFVDSIDPLPKDLPLLLNYEDPYTKLPFLTTLGLVWRGINDKNALKGKVLTIDDIEQRRKNLLLPQLAQLRRGNDNLIDSDDPDFPVIGHEGIVMLMSALRDQHQKITLPELNNARIIERCSELMAINFEKLEDQDKRNVAERWQEGTGVPLQYASELREGIEATVLEELKKDKDCLLELCGRFFQEDNLAHSLIFKTLYEGTEELRKDLSEILKFSNADPIAPIKALQFEIENEAEEGKKMDAKLPKAVPPLVPAYVAATHSAGSSTEAKPSSSKHATAGKAPAKTPKATPRQTPRNTPRRTPRNTPKHGGIS